MEPIVANLIVSVCAIVVPSVSSIIVLKVQNKHQKKMADKTFVSEHKIKAIDDYLENVGRYIFNQSTPESTLAKGMSIYMYIPKHLHKNVDELNELLLQIQRASNYEHSRACRAAARQKYMELCKSLADITEDKHWYTHIK